MFKKKAFTLSEILIAMTLLGVVASIVMMNIVGDYQENVRINRVKSTYQTLDYAVKASIAKYDVVTDTDQVIEFLDVKKDCGEVTAKTVTACWSGFSTDKVFPAASGGGV